MTPNRAREIAEKNKARFWKRVSKGPGCWLWLGAKGKFGYGVIAKSTYGQDLAHRYSYEIEKGRIPKDLCVLHSCDNPPCVNPDHLWIGTLADNNADMVRKGRQVTNPLLIRGSLQGLSRLTEDKVREIRTLRTQGKRDREIGNKFGIAHSTVSLICLRKTWAWLT